MRTSFFILVSLMLIAPCQARILYVDGDATSANDGSSWENAYRHLQDALADATADPNVSEIRVGQGTYRPDETTADPNGTGDNGMIDADLDGDDNLRVLIWGSTDEIYLSHGY